MTPADLLSPVDAPDRVAAMTHAALVERAVRWLRNTRKCGVVFAEISTYASSNPDAIGWRRSCSILVEVKVSRSDYRADAHKPSHRAGRLMGAERWYLTPPGLLRPDEVRPGWGLIEALPRQIRPVVKAPTIPREERAMDDELIVLLSAVQRHQIGVAWHEDRARFAPYRPGAL